MPGERDPQGQDAWPERIESWKRIAQYLGRSVRTVRRWERNEGLPVHRLNHGGSNSVFAMRSELEAWYARNSEPPREPQGTPGERAILVLPIDDLSPSQTAAHFCEGLRAELVCELVRRSNRRSTPVSVVHVPGEFAERSSLIRAAGRSASHAISGSLRLQGAEMKVTLELLQLPESRVLATYDSRLCTDDQIGVQEQIAGCACRTFIDALSSTLGPKPNQHDDDTGAD